ncbi:Phospholipase D beta 1 [Sesamum angolense]|uniref:phospholipase D n=1 Tax=Sesamum angolense TaxID=2727404 RepID=A0AAE1W9R9_9LAMI|nr:Phospholipase D beta 1 [Sesamum angolense]
MVDDSCGAYAIYMLPIRGVKRLTHNDFLFAMRKARIYLYSYIKKKCSSYKIVRNMAGCPREPWHDLHSKIEGPAAYDILRNFEERWRKASKRHGIHKMKHSFDDSLLQLDRIPDIVGIDESSTIEEHDPESWNVQVFRSIDSNSVKELGMRENVLIDMSIHTAYVKAIRGAQHYIYIENQYFLGSSYNWAHYRDLGANNLIPMEIAMKVANKIRARERFAAYIVVPMWPEGVPTSTPTQRILFWQYNHNMQMMYDTVYKALKETGQDTEFEPQDYLNFFCLGNREPEVGGPPSMTPNKYTPEALTRRNRRFMIYVHSKGMIVDDEYVILGSANINQRSLEGTRDTEIAMGAYQPQYTWASKSANPRGEIFGYRMSLWAEQHGTLEQCYEQPESVECVRRIRWMGELNWKAFESDEMVPLRGHLMKATSPEVELMMSEMCPSPVNFVHTVTGINKSGLIVQRTNAGMWEYFPEPWIRLCQESMEHRDIVVDDEGCPDHVCSVCPCDRAWRDLMLRDGRPRDINGESLGFSNG